MTSHPAPHTGNYSAQQTAHLFLALCRVAEHTRLRGSCVGELRQRDILIHEGGIARRRVGRIAGVRHRLARRNHLRRGHDQYCYLLGIPEACVWGLLQSWGGSETAAFLSEKIRDAVQHYARGAWQGTPLREVLKHEIGRCLTLEAPADSV